MDNLFEMIADFCRPLPVTPLTAIWLNSPVKIEGKNAIRITEGDKVYCEMVKGELELKDCIDKPNFIITSCWGRAASDFAINVMDLNTKELRTVKL